MVSGQAQIPQAPSLLFLAALPIGAIRYEGNGGTICGNEVQRPQFQYCDASWHMGKRALAVNANI